MNKTKTNFKPFEYEISNGEVIITSCDKSVTEVVIPSEIDGYPVTTIGESAFSWCKKLERVYIYKGIRKICRRAFYNCSILTSVTIPRTVIYIAPFSFGWCSKLQNVSFEIPNSKCRIDCTSGLNLNQCVDYNWR